VKIKSTLLLFALSAALIISSCGGGSTMQRPKIETEPAASDVTIETFYSFNIRNTGDAPLTVTAVDIRNVDGCPGDEEGLEPFKVDVLSELPKVINTVGGTGEQDENGVASVSVNVTFTVQAISCNRLAVLTISSDDPERPQYTMNIRTAKNVPYIEANPPVLDLGFVMEGQQTDGVLYIQNSGLDDLVIDRIDYRGTLGFRFIWGCELPPSEGQEPGTVKINANYTNIGAEDDPGFIDTTTCQPVVIKKNSSFELPVRYVAYDEEPAEAELSFYSNDPRFPKDLGQTFDVKLVANAGGPCIRIIPPSIDFGATVVPNAKPMAVYLESCGDEPVEVTDVRFSEDTAKEFNLSLDPLGAFNEANPLVLEPGEKRDFRITYVPTTPRLDPDGKPEPDLGKVQVVNSSPRGMVEAPISGLAVEAEQVVCEFDVLANYQPLTEGTPINPMTDLMLKDLSYDPTPGGGIKTRLWKAEQPHGSQEVFYPNSVYKDVRFTCNVIGSYRFILEVTNENGDRATCDRVVEVRPPEGCMVELTWNTPNDPDQTDQCTEDNDCGSDMDLHVVHPYATGTRKDDNGEVLGYFDDEYDCYWMNAHRLIWQPKFADNPLYQPHLDRDDTDGAGPEIFTYTYPDDKCLKIGVHYYDDHGFGASYPTIRVFISDSVPIWEKTLKQAMYTWDMWHVGTLCCTDLETPFTEHKKANGDPVIFKNYDSLKP